VQTSKDYFGSKYILEPVGDELFIHKAGFVSKTALEKYKAILV